MTFNELVPMLGKLYRNARKAPGFNYGDVRAQVVLNLEIAPSRIV